jgi:DNA polymerase III epsilon subunit-like protein
MIILCYDTETTGLPSAKLALNDPAQPHLVSCSALQVETSSWRIQQSMSKLVAPDGWEWPMDQPAALVHGLTPEECSTYGQDEKSVLDEFLHLWFVGDTLPCFAPGKKPNSHLVAHNLKFDRDIIAIAIARYYPGEATLLRTWQEAEGTCTMCANKERVDAKTSKGCKKFPNLKETYKFFLGEELERHHSANADAVAVYQIFMAMQEM